jgi:DNA-binding beta-propeller fold protein YncE
MVNGRKMTAAALLAGLACSMGACSGLDSASGGASGVATGAGAISGRYIAVMGDADLRAEGAGVLFERRLRDQLTLVALPLASGEIDAGVVPGAVNDQGARRWSTRVAQVPASSSAYGPPGGLAVSADGARAYVVEAYRPLAPRELGGAEARELEPGTVVTPIDLADPLQARALAPIVVAGGGAAGGGPRSVAVHPGGHTIAVATTMPDQQIVLISTPPGEGTSTGAPLAWPLLGVQPLDAPGQAYDVGAIAWHPTGRYLALALPGLDQVVLYEVGTDKASALPVLATWGEPVAVPARPIDVAFSRDGTHLVVLCAGSGGAQASAQPGTVCVLGLSEVPSETTAGDKPLGVAVAHRVVARETVGPGPEGLALSPDGRALAVVSFRGPSLFLGAGVSTGGGVYLLSIDPATGALSRVAERTLIGGGVPTGLSFDARGEHLVVAQVRSADPSVVDGELVFYRVLRAGAKSAPSGLEPLDFSVGIGTGPHGPVVVR